MGVDIGGRSNITVSKPFLDVLQRNAVCIKQAGAAMTKIVKTNLFQSLLLEKQVKMLCDKIGFDKSAHRIYIDVVQIIRAVAITTDLLIECLFCFEIAKQNFKRCNKRKCTATGFGLGGILLYHLCFSIHSELNHRMSDADGFAFKINGIPFQTNNFAAAQAIECAKDNCQFKRITFDCFEQSVQFCLIVDRCLILRFPGFLYPVSRIGLNQADLERILQTLSHIRMAADYRSRRKSGVEQIPIKQDLPDTVVSSACRQRKSERLCIASASLMPNIR